MNLAISAIISTLIAKFEFIFGYNYVFIYIYSQILYFKHGKIYWP
jgi:hypothetical protein